MDKLREMQCSEQEVIYTFDHPAFKDPIYRWAPDATLFSSQMACGKMWKAWSSCWKYAVICHTLQVNLFVPQVQYSS